MEENLLHAIYDQMERIYKTFGPEELRKYDLVLSRDDARRLKKDIHPMRFSRDYIETEFGSFKVHTGDQTGLLLRIDYEL